MSARHHDSTQERLIRDIKLFVKNVEESSKTFNISIKESDEEVVQSIADYDIADDDSKRQAGEKVDAAKREAHILRFDIVDFNITKYWDGLKKAGELAQTTADYAAVKAIKEAHKSKVETIQPVLNKARDEKGKRQVPFDWLKITNAALLDVTVLLVRLVGDPTFTTRPKPLARSGNQHIRTVAQNHMVAQRAKHETTVPEGQGADEDEYVLIPGENEDYGVINWSDQEGDPSEG